MILTSYSLFAGLTPAKANSEHHTSAKHHTLLSEAFSNDGSLVDWFEIILNFESAAFTNPEGGLNAFDTVNTYYPNVAPKVLPILEELGLNYSYDPRMQYPWLNKKDGRGLS